MTIMTSPHDLRKADVLSEIRPFCFGQSEALRSLDESGNDYSL